MPGKKTINKKIILENVSVLFDNREVLKNISLEFAQCNITAIMGPSGVGKTTLLKVISGLLKPHSGRVLFDGIDIYNTTRRELHNIRIKSGYMFQHGALFSGFSVFDNVAFGLRENSNLPESMIRDIVLLKLDSVGLRGVAYCMPETLSGGMARRVALARAVALDPEFMLYDEPFTGQDPVSTAVLLKLISDTRSLLKATSIIVSHDISAVKSVADEINIINNGSIVASGTMHDIENSSDISVQQFISGKYDISNNFHYPTKKTLSEDLS